MSCYLGPAIKFRARERILLLAPKRVKTPRSSQYGAAKVLKMLEYSRFSPLFVSLSSVILGPLDAIGHTILRRDALEDINFVIATVDVMEVLKGNAVPNPDRNSSSMTGAVSTNGKGISR